MRSRPPHPLIRFRFVLLVIAIASFGVGFALLASFEGDPAFPAEVVIAVTGIVFVWTNGIFWLLEFGYPHIEVTPGQYASRAELASGFARAQAKAGLVICILIAIAATIAALRVAIGA